MRQFFNCFFDFLYGKIIFTFTVNYPLYYTFIPSVDKLPFKYISSNLPDIKADSYYVYNWNGTLFILSYLPHQIKHIKAVVLQLLRSKDKKDQPNSHKKSKNSKNHPLPFQHTNKNKSNHTKRSKKTMEKDIGPETAPQSAHHQPFPPVNPVPQQIHAHFAPSAPSAPQTFLPSQQAANTQAFFGQQASPYPFQQQNYAAPVNQGYHYPSQFPTQIQFPQQNLPYPNQHYPQQNQLAQPNLQAVNFPLPPSQSHFVQSPLVNNGIYPGQYYPNTMGREGY